MASQLLVQVEASKSTARSLYVLNFDEMVAPWSELRVFDVLRRVVEKLPGASREQPVLPTIFLNATKSNMRRLESHILLTDADISPGDSLHVLFSQKRLQKECTAYNKYLDAALARPTSNTWTLTRLRGVGDHLWTMLRAEMDVARMICEQIGPTLAKHYSSQSCQNLVRMLVFGRQRFALGLEKLEPLLVRSLLDAGEKALGRRLLEEDPEYQNLCVQSWIQAQSSIRGPRRQITVDRKNLFQSTYDVFMMRNAWSLEPEPKGDPPRLSGGLDAQFKGEDGTGPGVTREFLLKALAETFDPKRGLFVPCPAHPDLFYPAPSHTWKASDETGMKTRMAGRLLGLCLQAKISPPVSLAPHVWGYVTAKFAETATQTGGRGNYSVWDPLSDATAETWAEYSQALAVAKPDIYASLNQVLRMSPEVLAATDLRFVVEEIEIMPFLSEDGIEAREARPVERDLIPDGAETVVNPANRETFTLEMARWHLVRSVLKQLTALRTGFRDVLAPFELVAGRDLVSPALLGRYARGRAKISVRDWRQNTVLKGFSARRSTTIHNFWRFLESLTQDGRSRVLSFCTSLKRLPPSGFAGLARKFTIQRGDPERLPSAHTCFYTLVLPPERSYVRFRDKCQVMLQDHSFGFQ